ncbi:glycosyltransferase [Nocardioides cynanchi]|uniref:glycosyltransferase n=1 Tax=Nocardioides cynanchi TaxID=2558918 RepID=UPI001243A783|nr:glycosyltransferase [Nocardioides cynanchi]
MRILFTFIGGLGHFLPMEPVARAAGAARHEVAVACSGGVVARVEAAGFRALATSPPRPTGSRPRDLTPLPPVDAHAAEVEFAENFAGKGARRHAGAVREHLGGWRPDLVVRDEADFGSAVAAEVLGVPVATVLVLASGMLIRPELVAEPLAAVRAEHGLAPDPDLSMLTRGLLLSPFPLSFRSPDSPVALPEPTFAFRGGDLGTGPPRRARDATRRVYVTLGTVFNSGSGDLFERLLAGLAGVDAEIVVTVGRDVDPADFGPQPPHLRVERFVPQADLLPDSDLVVSHGGSGTLMATLAHGLPSLLLPLGADQPHNAARARELGLARTLDAATATPDEIRRGVEDALHDQAAARRARAVADEISSLPGVERVTPLLEAFAGAG